MKLVRILAALGVLRVHQSERNITSAQTTSHLIAKGSALSAVGAVYTQTNDATANAVRAFARASDGTLTFVADYPTEGKETVRPDLARKAP